MPATTFMMGSETMLAAASKLEQDVVSHDGNGDMGSSSTGPLMVTVHATDVCLFGKGIRICGSSSSSSSCSPRAVCGATAVVGSGVLSHELATCDCWSARSRPTHMGPAGSRAPHAAAACRSCTLLCSTSSDRCLVPCWAPHFTIVGSLNALLG